MENNNWWILMLIIFEFLYFLINKLVLGLIDFVQFGVNAVNQIYSCLKMDLQGYTWITDIIWYGKIYEKLDDDVYLVKRKFGFLFFSILFYEFFHFSSIRWRTLSIYDWDTDQFYTIWVNTWGVRLMINSHLMVYNLQ